MPQLSPSPIPEALRDLYAAKHKLHSEFPDWPFSLDGKLIGDIGEAIAAKVFGLTRLPEGEKTHDLTDENGRLIQIKATQKDKESKPVGLGLEKRTFDHLIVLQFDQLGFYEVIFNGPGHYIDDARKHKKSASLSRKQLREINQHIPDSERTPVATQVTAAEPVA